MHQITLDLVNDNDELYEVIVNYSIVSHPDDVTVYEINYVEDAETCDQLTLTVDDTMYIMECIVAEVEGA